MRQLQDVRAKCSKKDGHWIWNGAVSGGLPRIYAPDFTADATGRTLKPQVGPRAVWHMKHKRPVPQGMRVFRTCEHQLCVRPECVEARTCADHGKAVAEQGTMKGQIKRIIANRTTNRARSDLTSEKVATIMASQKSGLELEAELGVCRTTISRLRTGKPSAFDPVATVFSGLLS